MSEIKYVQVGVQGPAGPSAHGDLSGLDDDDHPQYLNDSRAETLGDARWAPIAKGVTNGDTHDHNGGDGAAIAYTSLTGAPALGTAAALDYGTSAGNTIILDELARLPAVDGSQLVNLPGGGGGVTDHGALTGLADDDHSQYHNNARGDARYALLAKGVTNGDSHDHNGGDGAQIAYSSLSGLPTLGTAAATNSTAYDAAGAASAAQAAAIAASTPIAHDSNTSNPHSVTKSQVGLSNCDNTSDASKPVSTAQATADTAIGTAAASDATTKANAAQAAAIAACPAETATSVGGLIAGSSGKAVLVANDLLGVSDSAASNILKKTTLQNLIDSIKPIGSFLYVLKFPTWPTNAGYLLSPLVASSTASRSSGVVTVTATAHGVTTGAPFVGFRFYYPGSASLAAGWHDSITSITTNTIVFTADGADFASESINGGAAWTTATDIISMTIPGNTLRDRSAVTSCVSREGGATSATKTVGVYFGGSVVTSIGLTVNSRSTYKTTFVCFDTNKQWATQYIDGVFGNASYTATKDITADQTFVLRGTVSAAGDFLVINRAVVEVTP